MKRHQVAVVYRRIKRVLGAKIELSCRHRIDGVFLGLKAIGDDVACVRCSRRAR